MFSDEAFLIHDVLALAPYSHGDANGSIEHVLITTRNPPQSSKNVEAKHDGFCSIRLDFFIISRTSNFTVSELLDNSFGQKTARGLARFPTGSLVR